MINSKLRFAIFIILAIIVALACNYSGLYPSILINYGFYGGLIFNIIVGTCISLISYLIYFIIDKKKSKSRRLKNESK